MKFRSGAATILRKCHMGPVHKNHTINTYTLPLSCLLSSVITSKYFDPATDVRRNNNRKHRGRLGVDHCWEYQHKKSDSLQLDTFTRRISVSTSFTAAEGTARNAVSVQNVGTSPLATPRDSVVRHSLQADNIHTSTKSPLTPLQRGYWVELGGRGEVFFQLSEKKFTT